MASGRYGEDGFDPGGVGSLPRSRQIGGGSVRCGAMAGQLPDPDGEEKGIGEKWGSAVG